MSFYDDQMTHHAAALTYYALMSLFPALPLGLSLLGLLGEYPATYDAIMGYLLTNVALLLGAELDAEIERAEQLAEGVPPEDTLDLPPRG